MVIRAALSDAKAGIPQTTLPEEDELEEKIERADADSIASLPFEIFQLIFRLHCQSFEFPDVLDTDTYYEDLTDAFPVFALMQICSAWRQIVLKTPELWSVVSTNDRPRNLALARRWLSRAGNLPRTLTIILRYDYPLTVVHDLISQYPFRTLIIKEYLSGRFVDFRKIRAESFLLLEILVLLRSYDGPYIGLTFPIFPNLSCLRINGSFKILPFKTIPWPSLQQLVLDCTTPLSLPQSLTILRDATTLERANMIVMLDIQLPFTGDVVAANLSALHLRFGHSANPCNVGYFLDMLTAPKLKTLKLNNAYSLNVMECNISVFRRLVASSGMEIEELSIFRTTMPLSVGALLDCMPSLQRLELLGDSILDEDSMKRIATGELGPCLKAFYLRVRLVDPEAASPILTMIESRQNLARSESNRGNSYFKRVRIRIVGMQRGYTLRDYKERLGELEGIVKFEL